VDKDIPNRVDCQESNLFSTALSSLRIPLRTIPTGKTALVPEISPAREKELTTAREKIRAAHPRSVGEHTQHTTPTQNKREEKERDLSLGQRLLHSPYPSLTNMNVNGNIKKKDSRIVKIALKESGGKLKGILADTMVKHDSRFFGDSLLLWVWCFSCWLVL
jgi:hypothetical protein